MKGKLLIALIPLTILMIIASGAVYAWDKIDEVKFADSDLEALIRKQIGKSGGTIHKADVEGIEYLHISPTSAVLNLGGGAPDRKVYTTLGFPGYSASQTSTFSLLPSLRKFVKNYFRGQTAEVGLTPILFT